ncbi:MAG: polysaccharide biosynthesis protein [Bacillales bacterium]|jgi:O-antigen/teichoic acid export membrane protein|nr:polysaccharide biosynthesis protein [Bacillales bacterium]
MISTLKQKIHLIFQNRKFAKNVLILTSGNVIAQGIIFVMTPILSRIYSPTEFGHLAIYVSILAILASIGSLQFDRTITLPKSHTESANLVFLSFLILVLVSLFSSMLLWLFQDGIAEVFHAKSIKNFFFLLPLSLLAIGGNNILNSWAIRKGQYTTISGIKVIQSGWMVLTQVIGGLLMNGALPLLIGDVLGRASGNSQFILRIFREDRSTFKQVRLDQMWKLIKRYRKFPLYFNQSVLVRQLTLEMPVLLLMATYGASLVGLYVIVQRILSMPLYIIGTSIGNVYLSEASTRLHQTPTELKILFWNTMKHLVMIIVPILIIIVLLGPFLFPIVFGEEWGNAGKLLPILSCMYLFQFIVIPLESTLSFLERHDLIMVRELTRFIFIAVALLISNWINASPFLAMTLLSGAGSLSFIIHGLLLWLSIYQFEKKFNIVVENT